MVIFKPYWPTMEGATKPTTCLPLLIALITHNIAALIDSAKGTGVAAGTAGNTFTIVYFSLAVITYADSTYAAGAYTGTMNFEDSAIGTYLLTASALDAFITVDIGPVLH